MSCQVQLSANIADVANVRRFLYPMDDNRGSENWLQYCQISISPTSDTLVIALEKRLIVFIGKWDSHTSTNVYQITQENTYNDNIRAVLCLPIVGQSQSSQVGPDWTCIVVGFDTGYVNFLTENCTLLFEEQYHNESISSIKCQSQHSPRPDICSDLKPEELYIIYPSNVCVINGIHLFSMLRNTRSHLAKAQAQGYSMDTNSQQTTTPKKWGFTDQSQVNDACVVGLDLSNTFDHLLTASVCGGFDSKYRAMPPHNSLVVGVGSKPFVGFHYALEGGAQPVLSDVAKAVASKLKSALPGWLTGSKNIPEKSQSVSLQPTESMACRLGLCDIRRTANSLILSPDRRLAAVSDALGRVLLIDTHRAVALRIFKGYRDAQCAFLQIPDERKIRHKHGSKHTMALFLIIYSPRKGTLEIFGAQLGNKIAVFTASKASRLIYINYGLMGFETTSKSRFVCTYSCVFMDPDGQIKEIIIPFHYALTEKNNKRARDLHLYKRLKQCVKTGTLDPDKIMTEAYNTAKELKTMDVKLQFVDFLKNSKEINADVVIKCAEQFLEKINASETNLEPETIQFKNISSNLILLAHFYTFLSELSEDCKNGNIENVAKNVDSLVLGKKEMKNLQKLLDLSTINTKNLAHKVSFFKEIYKDTCLSQFLTVFELNNKDLITLKSDLSDLSVYQTGEIIFGKYITQSLNHTEFELYIRNSNIKLNDLFYLLINFWVNRPINTLINLEYEMQNFSNSLYTLTRIINKDELCAQNNIISGFWNDVRDILANSAKPFPALMAAILCKSVAQRIEGDRDFESSSTSLGDETADIWENLSQENCQWQILIGKLEDISLLNIILSNKPICSMDSLPKLELETAHVSLKYVLQNGKGSVSECVAKWLCLGGINPDDLILNDLDSQNKKVDGLSKDGDSSKSLEAPSQIDKFPDLKAPDDKLVDQPVFDHINILKSQFPYSLEPSVLLANMCWEYSLAWQKNMHDLSLLEAAMKCLQTIPNIYIKLGLYNLVWNTHLKVIFESSAKLINKVGKLPKERLCRQDTNLSDYQITLFMEICCTFFDGFMETILDSYNYERPVLRYEQIWEIGAHTSDGQSLNQSQNKDGEQAMSKNRGRNKALSKSINNSPLFINKNKALQAKKSDSIVPNRNVVQTIALAELTLTQTQINYDLLHLHYQLSLVLHMLCVYAIKHTKLINNLFDMSVISHFFTDLQQPSVSINFNLKVDSKVNASRLQFLIKVISASIETITLNEDVVYSTDHVLWMSKCLSLARIWNLDIDLLKRYQVAQIFSNGFDQLGEELLNTVTELNKLGPDLVSVAGKRLSQYLSSSKDLGEKITAFSTTLTKYLETLEGDWSTPSNLESIMTLITYSLRCLEETQTEHKIACLMLEACSTLQDIT